MNNLIVKINVVFALIFLLLPTNLFGQSLIYCFPPTIKEAKAESAAIFTGTILSISKYDFGDSLEQKQQDGDDATYKVLVRVDKFWKGVRAKQVAFLIYLGNSNKRFTLASIKDGERFLVYAKKWKSLNELYVPAAPCTRTRKIEDAKEDFFQLGKGKKVK